MATDSIVLALTDKRAELGLSLDEVAAKAKVVKSTMHYWEHGTRSPTLFHLRAWAKALGFRILIEEEGPLAQAEEPVRYPWDEGLKS